MCVCAQGKRERDKNYVVLVLEKPKERGTYSTKIFFLREERPPRAVVLSLFSLSSSKARHLNFLALSLACFRSDERHQGSKKAPKKSKRGGVFEENWGEKQNLYMHGTYIYIPRANPQEESETHKKKPLLLLLLRERDLFVEVARAMEVRSSS